jgi:hypothetical protein
MRTHRTSTLALFATGALIVGLATPAAVSEASTLINGKSIAKLSIPGNRLEYNTITGRQVKESTLGTVPKAAEATTAIKLPPLKWHTVTSFQNNWIANGNPVGYAVDAQGIVHLRGAISGGTVGTEVAQLPTSFGDGEILLIPVAVVGGIGSIEILKGVLKVISGTGDSQSLTFLNGVTFSLKLS